VYWGIGTPVDNYRNGNPLNLSAEMTRRASIVPTRLTRFDKSTRTLIVRAGNAHTEAAISASRISIPNDRPASFAAYSRCLGNNRDLRWL
jgi:NTE family protein